MTLTTVEPKFSSKDILSPISVIKENRKGRRGRGRQSVTLTPPPRSPASSVGAGDLYEGVGVVDWWPQTPNRPGTRWRSLVDSGFGPPIGDPNPSTEVAGTHRGCRRLRWRDRGRRLAAPTPPSLSIFF
ncbi:hypothetical protein CRG98_036608 [Punica granatum]|uniref:Uncharacterized protein n=1 Tax=Punica granatum TaxID=22663 RepID=A0A2I0IG68_PUNGR|nr:hypothetical protein CRG98_036608 [Punica granatum]